MNSLRRIIAVLCAVMMIVCVCPSAFASQVSEVVIDDGEAAGETDEAEEAEPEIVVPEVPEGSAVVVDCRSGAVLYEKSAYSKRPMASTTKIMTALLALETGDLGREIIISEEMLAYDEDGSTKLGLVLGDHITLHDLVVAMLLLSGNDCAQAVAVAVAGSFDEFASMMNERASEIGMLDTHFITPSGLDDEAHYSTAYDMALLGIEAMKNEDFASICSLKSATVWFGNPMAAHIVASHNYILEGLSHSVKGCDGIKTGYTSSAGFCLVSHCKRDGVELVCVTLGVPTYWSYQGDLYDYAFGLYTKVEADPSLPNDTMMVLCGSSQTVRVVCDVGEVFSIPKSQVDEITADVEMSRYEYAPISAGQIVGKKTYYYGTMPIAEYPIRAAENIDCVTNDWLSAYIDAIKFNIQDDSQD